MKNEIKFILHDVIDMDEEVQKHGCYDIDDEEEDEDESLNYKSEETNYYEEADELFPNADREEIEEELMDWMCKGW